MKKSVSLLLIFAVISNVLVMGENNQQIMDLLESGAASKTPVILKYRNIVSEAYIVDISNNEVTMENNLRIIKFRPQHIEKIALLSNENKLEIRVSQFISSELKKYMTDVPEKTAERIESESPANPETRYRNMRLALISGCLLPGGGQFYNGHIVKSIIIAGVFTGAVITAFFLRDKPAAIKGIFITVAIMDMIYSWIDAGIYGYKKM